MTEPTNTDDGTPLTDPPKPLDAREIAVQTLAVLKSLDQNVAILGHEVHRFSGRLSYAERAIEELQTQVVAGVQVAPPPSGEVADPHPMRGAQKSLTTEVRDSVRAVGLETKKQTPMIATAAAAAQETQATTARVEEKVSDAIGGTARQNQKTTLLLIVLAALGLASQVMQHLNTQRVSAPASQIWAPVPAPAPPTK